jgi:hypothetical protein
MDAGDRVQHRTSQRRGTIRGWRWVGEQLVDDIETGPYRVFYYVQWDDGDIDRFVFEKDLGRSTSR